MWDILQKKQDYSTMRTELRRERLNVIKEEVKRYGLETATI